LPKSVSGLYVPKSQPRNVPTGNYQSKEALLVPEEKLDQYDRIVVAWNILAYSPGLELLPSCAGSTFVLKFLMEKLQLQREVAPIRPFQATVTNKASPVDGSHR